MALVVDRVGDLVSSVAEVQGAGATTGLGLLLGHVTRHGQDIGTDGSKALALHLFHLHKALTAAGPLRTHLLSWATEQRNVALGGVLHERAVEEAAADLVATAEAIANSTQEG